MHHLLWPVCALALMTAACDSRSGSSVRIISTSSSSDTKGVLKVVSTLQCPQSQGVLTRKGSARADGTSCVYSGPRGTEVTLNLVSLEGGSADQALKSFERRLSADLPEALADIRSSEDRARAEAARAERDVTQADPDAARAEMNARRAEADASADGETTHITAPGMQIDAEADKATVRLPGMRIEANGDKANIRIGGLTIRADDHDAQVLVSTDDGGVTINANDRTARIRTSARGDAIRATFLLTSDRATPAGWQVVGYEARGPVGGPMVVATVRGKNRDEKQAFDAVKALVTLNVGD